MGGTKIHVEEVSLDEYERLEPERAQTVEDEQLYSLLMRRTHGRGAEVLRVATYVHLHHELGQFGVIFTDKDLRPAHTKELASRLVDRYWLPERDMIGNDDTERYGTGFFVPYDDGLEEYFGIVRDVLVCTVPIEFI